MHTLLRLGNQVPPQTHPAAVGGAERLAIQADRAGEGAAAVEVFCRSRQHGQQGGLA